jgi:hypothetical protein
VLVLCMYILTRSGVEVKFDHGRPEKKMKLVITVNGEELVKHEIARSGAVEWKGNM